MFFSHGSQEALYTDMSPSEVSDPHPSFPTKNPTLKTTFIYIFVIMLYKLHSSLNNQQAAQCWWNPPTPPFFKLFFLDKPGGTKVSFRRAGSEPAEVIWATGSQDLCSCQLGWSVLCKPPGRLGTPTLQTGGKSALCTNR